MELKNLIMDNRPPADPEDLEFLLELSELLRSAVREGRLEDAAVLVRYTVANRCHEAFYWAMGIMEECWAQTAPALPEFECAIGRYIPDYSALISRLGVDLNASGNDVLPVRDEHGEIQSFYNIITYKTGFSHIRLETSENFDARDNDFIEYRLICSAQ